MRKFAELFSRLDQSPKPVNQIAALFEYLELADEPDKLWAIALLSHQRPSRIVPLKKLQEYLFQYTNTSKWLFEASLKMSGNVLETVSLILPNPAVAKTESLSNWINFIKELSGLEEVEQGEKITDVWTTLHHQERYVFNLLLTGGFRLTLDQKIVVTAISKHTKLAEHLVAHRISGNWKVEKTSFKKLILSAHPGDEFSAPYPFFRTYDLDKSTAELGSASDWISELKWDGKRSQLIVREGYLFLWSGDGKLWTEQFPEFKSFSINVNNGTVIDGEILAFKDGQPMPLKNLESRIGKKNISKKVLTDCPVIFMAYDLLELDGKDIRQEIWSERRAKLETLLASANDPNLILSPAKTLESWEQFEGERQQARASKCFGIVLKKKHSIYQSGRHKNDWWKCKSDPFFINAVMIYAAKLTGSQSNLFTQFTFGVWDKKYLVPFTKATGTFSDEELSSINLFIKNNLIEKFGPVRSVRGELVFKVSFDNIIKSARHKSGVVLRNPKIVAWLQGYNPKEANSLSDLQQLLDL